MIGTPMTQELREAAERLRSRNSTLNQVLYDREVLSEAWLAEHPSDDDEPLTIEEAEQLWDQAVQVDPDAWGAVSQRNGQIGIHVDAWIPLKTRRDARRLLRALGGTSG